MTAGKIIRVMKMEIQTLKYFLETAKVENITKAANILHTSQPSLSKHIKNLEESLGKKLFLRGSKNVTLTEEGLLLKQRAEEILSLVEKTEREFKSLDEIVGGDIYIGCAEADGFKFFVRALKKVQKKYPQLRCHLYSSDGESVTDKLERGILDFAIIAHGNINLQKYNYATLPTKNLWGLIIRKDSPLAEKKEITREDLLQIPIICSRQGLVEELSDWFGKDIDKLNLVATYDMIFNASIMVREKFGNALGYEKIVYTGESGELCFRPLAPKKESPMHIIWKKNKVFTPVAESLIACLID